MSNVKKAMNSGMTVQSTRLADRIAAAPARENVDVRYAPAGPSR